jgi:DNA polymerase-1
MGGCNNCFFKGRTISGDGDPSSPFVIVGESAGAIEIHKGLPFQGPSGRLLKEVLVRNGFMSEHEGEDGKPVYTFDKDLPEPYYTNAISCMPRQKDPEKLAAACIRCRGRLLEELQAHPRKLILALGNGALWSTTGNFDLKITKERGKLFKSELAECGVLATLHPSYMLRGSGNFKQWDSDFQYAKQLLQQGEEGRKKPTSTTYTVLENIFEVIHLTHQLKDLPSDAIIASDIETTGFSHLDDKILCLGIQFEPNHSYIIPRSLILPSLFENDADWYWHNGKFDVKFLWEQHKCYYARVDGDTMLLSYALNERGGIHDLDQSASDWLGSPNHKSMLDPYTKGTIVDPTTGLKRKRNYGDVPTDILHKYLAFDLNDTYNLAIQLRAQVAQDLNDDKLYTKTLIPGSRYLAKMERNGFLVDLDWVGRNAKAMKARLDTLEHRMDIVTNHYGSPPVNPRSWQQLQEFMYSGKYIKGMGNMGMSTDDDTLKNLPKLRRTKKQHIFVQLLREHRKVQKGYSTYVKAVYENMDSDGRVHTTYLLHGTATGRLSSRNPNMQNIPRLPKLRGQFMARPGYGIIECDFSQAELRCLAHLSGCTALRAVFNQGLDLHVELSTFLFGENFTKEDKMKAKTVNFGIVYGREAPSIAEAFKVSVEEAQSWIDGWFKRFPGAGEFIKQSREAPINNQTIITAFGNKKRPGVVTMDKLRDLMNESANFPHQNIASNLTMHAGIKLIDPLAVELDTYLCNTVHDCLVGEVPGDLAHIKLVADYMTSEMQKTALEWGFDSVPFKAEAEFGWRWGNLVKVDDIDKKYNGDIHSIPLYIPAH